MLNNYLKHIFLSMSSILDLNDKTVRSKIVIERMLMTQDKTGLKTIISQKCLTSTSDPVDTSTDHFSCFGMAL